MPKAEVPVTITSIYGYHHRRPLVELRIGDHKGHQFSPAEARRIALLLLGAAEAAEQDAFMVEWGERHIGLPLEQSVRLLAEFRVWRERRAQDGEEQ